MSIHNKILIIEENAAVRSKLSNFLSKLNYRNDAADSLQNALDKIIHVNNFSLLLIRFKPSDTNILSIIHNIKTFNPNLGILLLTQERSNEWPISLIKTGLIDHVVSPDNMPGIYSALKNEFAKRELFKRVDACEKRLFKYKIDQEKNLKKAMVLEEIYDSTLENLMTALDLRDVETFGHSRTVAKYSQVLAQLLGIKDKQTLDNIRKGALLHDIGKIAIPDSILKKASPLSEREWEKIKMHPSLGYGLIKEIKLVKEIGNIILFHHERYDGSGYPRRLKKNKIPSEARIFALADALDAITSHRPYRKEKNFAFAKQEILRHVDSQFDPDVVKAFCSFPLEKWEKIRFETTKLIPYYEDMMKAVK